MPRRVWTIIGAGLLYFAAGLWAAERDLFRGWPDQQIGPSDRVDSEDDLILIRIDRYISRCVRVVGVCLFLIFSYIVVEIRRIDKRLAEWEKVMGLATATSTDAADCGEIGNRLGPAKSR